jgi:hypothetical protein
MLVMNNVQDIPENLIWLVNNEPVFKRQSGIYIFRFNKCEVGYANDAINFLNCYTTLDFQRARELMLGTPAMELEPMTDWGSKMIQADDPRLKTAEGWVALGAPKDATHWIGPHEDPWEKHEGNNRVTWIEEVKQWSDYTFAVRTGVDEIACDYTIIPRPVSEEAKALDEVEEVSA